MVCFTHKEETTMIILKNVSHVYGEGEGTVQALKDVNLVIEDGKFTCILGKSGSGKSTLMNIIGALDIPSSGKVYSGGVDLSALN